MTGYGCLYSEDGSVVASPVEPLESVTPAARPAEALPAISAQEMIAEPIDKTHTAQEYGAREDSVVQCEDVEPIQSQSTASSLSETVRDEVPEIAVAPITTQVESLQAGASGAPQVVLPSELQQSESITSTSPVQAIPEAPSKETLEPAVDSMQTAGVPTSSDQQCCNDCNQTIYGIRHTHTDRYRHDY